MDGSAVVYVCGVNAKPSRKYVRKCWLALRGLMLRPRPTRRRTRSCVTTEHRTECVWTRTSARWLLTDSTSSGAGVGPPGRTFRHLSGLFGFCRPVPRSSGSARPIGLQLTDTDHREDWDHGETGIGAVQWLRIRKVAAAARMEGKNRQRRTLGTP